MEPTTPETQINYSRIEQAILYLETNFLAHPGLEEISEKLHLSPYHFQRIFTEWAGVSPKRFIQFLTVRFLKEKLEVAKNLAEAAQLAGLSSQSRVYDLFTTLEGVTPQEYKQRGTGLRISYGFHETPFGTALLGVTDRGICWLSFLVADEDERTALEQIKEHWYNSHFFQDVELTNDILKKIFYPDNSIKPGKLHVLVKGTNFQLKVWDALLRIPAGSVTTYQGIANSLSQPGAMQAVGSAVGANHIGYLIPCHRVIRKDGILSDYRWSAARKKSILGWEFAKADGESKG
ncbi:MAG: methylated-DNA--[protein]-cysteine S-methyltransferase [Chryseolinea sp.]